MEKISALLDRLGLNEYINVFKDNDIDDSLLSELTSDDLKEIGIDSLGKRKKILTGIAELGLESATGATSSTSQSPRQQESAHIPSSSEDTNPPEGSPDQAVADRREVTTLFADLTGYTNLSRELEAEDLHGLLTIFYDRFDQIVKKHKGTVERHIGDCVMAVFGAPVSYGNEAERALRASLEMHNAMEEISADAGREYTVHIGVASGNVLFSSRGQGSLKELDFSLTGDSVNLASRLADQAEAGQTFITERIQTALGDLINVDALEKMSVKGFEEPLAVFQFLGFSNQGKARKVIGRDTEVEMFNDAISDCLSTGQGGTVAVVADAGLGKSSLVEEFERKASLKGFSVHKSFVLDFGLSDKQNPVRTMLRSLCDISEDCGEAVSVLVDNLDFSILDQQSRLLLVVLLGGELSEVQQQIYDAMSDDVRFEITRRLFVCLLEGLSASRAQLLIVEDVHWAGRETLEQLALFAAASKSARVILIMTTRPLDYPLDDSWFGLSDHARFDRLDLLPLSAENSLLLAQQIASPMDREVLEACISRAEGNPLFLDQLLKHANDTKSGDVPGSIQSIVQAKLDRLEQMDRVVLEGAAVMGQRFNLNDVRSITDISQADDTHLLEAALIRSIQQGYLFAHALIRDAVLRTMLRDRLRELHLKAAELFRNRDLVLYAEHLAAARDKRAGQAYLDAARQAAARHRKENALSLTQRGLMQQAAESINVELLTIKGDTLRGLGRGEEAIDAFESILALTSSPEEQCRAKLGMVATMRIMDRIDDAFVLLDEIEPVAKEKSLILNLSEVFYFRGSLHFPRGEMEDCLNAHTSSLEYARESGHPEREALALSGLGDAHYARGRMFTAHEVIQQCLDLCDKHHLLGVKSANRFMLATAKIYLNETLEALEEARASSDLACTVGHARAEIVSRLTTGWILASMGKGEEAEEEIGTGLLLAEQLGAKRFEPFLEETLAEVALNSGDTDKAREIAENALQKARDLNAMSFIGPWLLSTAARATTKNSARLLLLAEGEALLAEGCVGHNYYRFYKNAMEASLQEQQWDEARRYADCLEQYTNQEPTPWSDFFISRARAIADAYEGKGSSETIGMLIATARSVRHNVALPALETASTI